MVSLEFKSCTKPYRSWWAARFLKHTLSRWVPGYKEVQMLFKVLPSAMKIQTAGIATAAMSIGIGFSRKVHKELPLSFLGSPCYYLNEEQLEICNFLQAGRAQHNAGVRHRWWRQAQPPGVQEFALYNRSFLKIWSECLISSERMGGRWGPFFCVHIYSP